MLDHTSCPQSFDILYCVVLRCSLHLLQYRQQMQHLQAYAAMNDLPEASAAFAVSPPLPGLPTLPCSWCLVGCMLARKRTHPPMLPSSSISSPTAGSAQLDAQPLEAALQQPFSK